jgi:hypothetical protein
MAKGEPPEKKVTSARDFAYDTYLSFNSLLMTVLTAQYHAQHAFCLIRHNL